MRIGIGTGLAVTVLLASAAPVDRVAPVNAWRSICGSNTLCANDPPPEAGDQATAEQKIIDGYNAKQVRCTPTMPPNPRSVTWDPPGFAPNIGGTGVIHDANPQLGGQYEAGYVNGRWHIEYLFC
ncbi:integrase [Mycobacterium shigaense]|uniref:Uncharacterized protein n=1 Tax=Mycobacterium shigaense TaxID=722731 RepID=A0A1Z4ENK4_9MYCO|nr:integrase [Mycobacterium shigaense]MEA1122803.1 integrase [Mycobacterium shigaense]PRI14804.1 integrase [Mycobacterium shigaense]BAX94583.1 hypothetical protein MSG_04468 [Mycobacterium shigaense]